MDAEEALNSGEALNTRLSKGLIFHSDRGSQYTSKRFGRLLKKHHIQASMSGVDACWDNAVVERFVRCERKLPPPPDVSIPLYSDRINHTSGVEGQYRITYLTPNNPKNASS